MAIGAEIAPAHPAPIGTIRVGAEMHGGVDRTTAPARHDNAWGWSGGGLRAGSGGVLTGVAVRPFDEAFKGFRLTAPLRPWRWGGQGGRARRGGVTGPHPMDLDAQPDKSNQRELLARIIHESQTRPSYSLRNVL